MGEVCTKLNVRKNERMNAHKCITNAVQHKYSVLKTEYTTGQTCWKNNNAEVMMYDICSSTHRTRMLLRSLA